MEPKVVKKVKAKSLAKDSIKKTSKVVGKPIKKGKVQKNGSSSKVNKKVKKKKSTSDIPDIESLKDLDPEFYDFLKKNDKKLLEFNVFDSDASDEESPEKTVKGKEKKQKAKKAKMDIEEDSISGDDMVDEEAEEDSEDDDEGEEKYHKPTAELEVASDESDFEEDDDDDAEAGAHGIQKVTLNLLRQWQIELEKPNPSIDTIRSVIQAFSSALASLSSDSSDAVPTTSKFKVVGSSAFNGVVQLCVLHLQPAVLKLLGVKQRSNMPLHKTKKWVKVRSCLRYYLTDLASLIEQVSSPNILTVLLKHLHQMSGMVGSFSTLAKTILKRLIILWSTGDETVRVLAFLCILKITRNQQKSMLNHVLKAMYLSYVRNSKFVSPNSLPGINFMRRSLVEMFALDLNVSYQHAFLFIRQLAIHLRNAVILKKKDSIQSVYNWQYVNSLRLWCDLLGATANKPQLQALVYPLVTITIGVIRLVPTAQYFPLRFHCLQALISLSKESNTFIPVLPLILEVLRSNTFNKKHTNVSMRPMQFTCILRLNKTQLSENGFRDEVVEQVCGLCLQYLANESASLAFSDLVVPSVIAMKAYLKECRNANYSRKLKTLLEKIQDNARFIEQERSKITFGLQDLAQINAWETQVRAKGTPLSVYYSSWVKTHEIKKRRQAAQTDSINDDYNLPKIKRVSKENGASKKQLRENGDVELFPSDSEDDDMPRNLQDSDEDEDFAEQTKTKGKKAKSDSKTKKDKNKKVKVDKKTAAETKPHIPVEEDDDDDDGADNVDIVKDLDLDDW